MKPTKKGTCADDCTAWNETSQAKEVSKCSIDNETIRIKARTPSTEEIREQMNIKVQDEDGRTLYERKDYTCGNQHEAVLGDLYKESKQKNRVATPLTVTNLVENDDRKELTPYVSDKSLLNALEINFKLCITQGDKTTEIDIGNDNNNENRDVRSDPQQSNPEVFILNNGRADAVGEIPKNDINIKITLRNFKSKQKHKIAKDKKRNDDFSKKISEKFQTVSTGYSDVEEDNAFSVHRAAINLALSADVSHISSKIHNVPNCALSLHSTDLVTEDENTEDTSSKIDVEYKKVNKTLTNESVLPNFNETDTEEDTTLKGNTSDCNDSSVMSKLAFREQKKALLKKVFQKAGKKSKNKVNVRELRDMLKIILTDSSDNDETNASSNTLAQDVTYTSLKPNYFKDTDSMNNYYKLDSNELSVDDSKINAVYPTAEANSRTSSDTEDNDMTFRGCMCSKVAERLNQANANKIGCCCRQNYKQDEETYCDIRNADDYFLLNYKTTEYVDVETQNSRRLTSKVNSYDISIQGTSKNSVLKTSEDVKVVEEITAANSLNQRASKPITQSENLITSSTAKSEDLKEPKVEEIKILKSPVSKEVSTHVSYQKSVNREPEIKQIYQSSTAEDNSVLGDKKLTELSIDKSTNNSKRSVKSKKSAKNEKIEKSKTEKPVEDILQSYAAKKAVLEIYAEKTENGDSFVAKLPKFVIEKESEIVKNFEQIAANSYKSMCKENVFIVSVKR